MKELIAIVALAATTAFAAEGAKTPPVATPAVTKADVPVPAAKEATKASTAKSAPAKDAKKATEATKPAAATAAPAAK